MIKRAMETLWNDRRCPATVAALGAALALAGYYLVSGVTAAIGWLVIVGGVSLWVARRRAAARHTTVLPHVAPPSNESDADDLPPLAAAQDIESLVDQMLARGRYALLLRPQIADNLSGALYQKAFDALQHEMGLVPAGDVQLEPSVFDIDYLEFAGDDSERPPTVVISVHSVFLDRYPVTNKQFHRFVAAGGYQEMAIWDQEVWPAVLDFVDSKGHSGPRFWKNGHYPPGESNLPVVGISWYEAAAYSRWVGKRLPTDAEWVKAGSWPVTLSHHTRLQRKYPWGDTMDRRKANVWGSGPGRIVPVDEFAEGVSVGGLYQLIGNVWEWTGSNLDIDPGAEDDGRGDRPLLKSIRGGAYDSYFENQANCQFASGENPIARKHNIGFRCALGVAEVASPTTPPADRSTTAHDELPREFALEVTV